MAGVDATLEQRTDRLDPSTAAVQELLADLLTAGYVATAKLPTRQSLDLQPEPQAHLSLESVDAAIEIYVTLSDPHVQELLKVFGRSFAEELGKRSADGVAGIPAIVIGFVIGRWRKRRPVRVVVKDESGRPVQTVDADSLVAAWKQTDSTPGSEDADADSDGDGRTRSERGPRHRAE